MKLGTRPTIGIRLRARVSRPCSIFVLSDLTHRRGKCVNVELDPLGIDDDSTLFASHFYQVLNGNKCLASKVPEKIYNVLNNYFITRFFYYIITLF